MEPFLYCKSGGPGALVPWTGGWWSTLDYERRRPWRSPELLPHGVAGFGSSLQIEEKIEEVMGNLTKGSFDRIDSEVRLEVVVQRQR
jgi:hypothetical protein